MKNTNFTCSHLGRFPAGFIFLIASVSYIVNADAQLSWGVNGAGGDGTWDSATPNWSDGTNNVPWVNGGSAAFGGVAGTVSISGSVTASEVAFGVPGYVLQNGTLSGAPGGITVRTHADATINSALTSPVFGTGDFTKSGAAKLTTAVPLNGFGRVNIEAGELEYGDSYINKLAMGYWQNSVLTIGSSVVGFSVSALSGGGVIQPRADGGAKTLYLYGAGDSFGGMLRDHTAAILSVVKTSTGLQRLTGANAYSGPTSVSGGTLALAESGSALNSAFTINGGVLLLDNAVLSSADRLSDTAPINLLIQVLTGS